MRRTPILVALVATAVLAIGCRPSSPAASEAALATPAPSASASARPSFTPTPTPSMSPTRSAAPSVTPTASPDRVEVVAGQVVTTLADAGLRVRSAPRVSDDSHRYDPLLPLGTRLYVLQGPVSASGYSWFEVVPLDQGHLPRGWVAAASRDGEPWLEPATFDCPPKPTDMGSLAALPRGVGLACFARAPITVNARLISCNCDVDGSWYTPSWFFLGSGGPELLVPPEVSSVPRDMSEWFALDLDPEGDHPDVLPMGKVVEITGMFDHPAAAACTRTDMDGQPTPTGQCRAEFAVTRLAAT